MDITKYESNDPLLDGGDDTDSDDESSKLSSDDGNMSGGTLDYDDDEDEDYENDENADSRTKRIFGKSNKEPDTFEIQNTDEYGDEYNDDDEEDDEEYDENYLQKFDETLKQNIISEYHPEMQQLNYNEVELLTVVRRGDDGEIYDPLHRTLPFLTKFEKARVLGERAKQINDGAKPFVKTPMETIDGYLIALAELEQKAIPFIIKRPLPNGGCEYWKLKDLEVLM
jgi:DNA-directed RNA polymerase subunit K/omega